MIPELYGLKIESDISVPKGKFGIDEKNGRILVHPDCMDDFLNLMGAEFEDLDGHKVFAA